MSRSYPIISITGSSGAGTTSVKRTFENIFRREKVAAAYIERDNFKGQLLKVFAGVDAIVAPVV